MSITNPVPPLSNQITDSTVTLTWSAYFSNLKTYLDELATATVTKLHNALDSIQGGSITERYHLTQAEWQNAVQLPTFNGDNSQFVNGSGGLSFPFHNETVGLQGGDGTNNEYYHLSADEYASITTFPVFNGDYTVYLSGNGLYSKPLHNNAPDLQGGATADYQHLTTAQVDKLTNIESKIAGYVALGI